MATATATAAPITTTAVAAPIRRRCEFCKWSLPPGSAHVLCKVCAAKRFECSKCNRVMLARYARQTECFQCDRDWQPCSIKDCKSFVSRRIVLSHPDAADLTCKAHYLASVEARAASKRSFALLASMSGPVQCSGTWVYGGGLTTRCATMFVCDRPGQLYCNQCAQASYKCSVDGCNILVRREVAEDLIRRIVSPTLRCVRHHECVRFKYHTMPNDPAPPVPPMITLPAPLPKPDTKVSVAAAAVTGTATMTAVTPPFNFSPVYQPPLLNYTPPTAAKYDLPDRKSSISEPTIRTAAAAVTEFAAKENDARELAALNLQMSTLALRRPDFLSNNYYAAVASTIRQDVNRPDRMYVGATAFAPPNLIKPALPAPIPYRAVAMKRVGMHDIPLPGINMPPPPPYH